MPRLLHVPGMGVMDDIVGEATAVTHFWTQQEEGSMWNM